MVQHKFDEQAVASIKASVMIYDDSQKRWLPAGTQDDEQRPGLSKVQIYQHTEKNTFRVVGRRIPSHEVVINCAILKGLRYNQATPTFHQWRDPELRQVYGLNFTNKDDADTFGDMMERAIEVVTSMHNTRVHTTGTTMVNVNGSQSSQYACPQNGHGVPQSPHHVVSAPQLRSMPNNNMQNCAAYPEDVPDTYQQPGAVYSRKSSSGPPPQTTMTHVRRASQGSTGSSSTGSGSGNNNVIYSSTPAPPAGVMSSPARMPPPAPPPLPNGTVKKAPMGAAPPPPAPPPPPALLMKGPGPSTPNNLANALAAKAAELNKRSESTDTPPNSGPKKLGDESTTTKPSNGAGSATPFRGDMMSEMAATLARRKAMLDNGSEEKICNNSGEQTPPRKPWANGKLNGEDMARNTSPKNNHPIRRMPSGSSLSSQEETLLSLACTSNANRSALSMNNNTNNFSSNVSTPQNENFAELKQEILGEVRQEIAKAKLEIIEAIRLELSNLRT